MASEKGTEPGEVFSPNEEKNMVNDKEKKQKVSVRNFFRKYTVVAEFTAQEAFDKWLAGESMKAPWYLCSSYQAGGIVKRIYACSFRKRAGYKKCERQMMVLFYPEPDNRIIVQDSSSNPEHIHHRTDSTDESRELRVIITLRSQAEFSSWMAKQKERYAWHRRAGRRSLENVDYYLCGSVGPRGETCKRLIHVEQTPENGIIIKEYENLPPHDSVPAHRKQTSSFAKSKAEGGDIGSEFLLSPGQKKGRSVPAKFVFGNMKQEPEGEEGEEDDAAPLDAEPKTGPSLEDFVIIPDEEYEAGDYEDEQYSGRGQRDVKQEVLDRHNLNASDFQVKKELLEEGASGLGKRGSYTSHSKPSSQVANGGMKSKRSSDRQNATPSSSKRRSWKNGPEIESPLSKPPKRQRREKYSDIDEAKYNLENFTEELASKLSKTPLERMKEVRESVRREMDEVFAQQIVKEIANRAYSLEARREVLDRIRAVLRTT